LSELLRIGSNKVLEDLVSFGIRVL
jgi:hypothetical protein